MLISIAIKHRCFGITQEIHTCVQDFSTDKFSIHKKIRRFARKNSNKNNQKLSFSNRDQDARCQMPPVFEVNAFKLILKCVFAHNFPGDYCRIPEFYF